MKRDITSESYFIRIKISLVALLLAVVIITFVGIFLVFNADETSGIICFACGYGIAIVMSLPEIIYHSVSYKRFKKLLKSSVTLYGTLNEVTYASFFASIFYGGCRVVIDGHYSHSIYPYKLVNKLTNTRVEFITDGEKVYLINPVD